MNYIAQLEQEVAYEYADRMKWIRLFNRLDAAVARHRRDSIGDGPDLALAAAHDRVLKAAAKKPEVPA